MNLNPTWLQAKRFFEPDDGLRDFCVYGVTLAEWQAVFELVTAKYQTHMMLDGILISRPFLIQEVFENQRDSSTLLKVFVDEMVIHSHFFSENEIDFDLDPREVLTEVQFLAVLDFMRLVGEACQKNVHLSYEGDWHNPIFIYDSQLREFGLGEF